MAHSVRRHLRLDIDDYDATIRSFIPGYDEMLQQAAMAVAATEPRRVLDLGAGTGALSEALLLQPGVGDVVLLDVDPEMLDQARLRLVDHADRVHFTLRSYDEPLPECDAIAAMLALHHIGTLEQKADLFGRAFERLPPGGVLVNADASMPDDAVQREHLYRYWADHMVASGIAESRAWQHFEEWSDEDTYLPLEDELDALTGAGFDARCIWRAGPMGVVAAQRRS